MPGSRGGDVVVVGDGICAIGGQGGGGGISEGMAGMDVTVPGNCVGSFVVGGMGGEADQPDGRGGRGGRNAAAYEVYCRVMGIKPRPHVKLPYDEPNSEPGRGGDKPDTPQYKARRIIIEQFKQDYLAGSGLSNTDVWYERDTIPLDYLNGRLAAEGHHWTVSIVDLEYAFTDVS